MTSGEPGDQAEAESAPSPEGIRAQLDHILASPHFAGAERSKRFLAFIVDETLAGRGERLKEYTLAVEVFDRDDSFDPRSNPTVRVEASRLRRRLEHYYLTLGREDPVLIEMPRGTYIPLFRPKADVLHLQEALAALDPKDLPDSAFGITGRPWIAVLPFTNLDGGESVFADGMTAEIITALSRFRDFHVLARDTAFHHGPQDPPARVGAQLGARCVLQGSVQRDEQRVRVHATLSSGATGEVLWADRYERDLRVDSIFDIQGEIASHVAATIALPQGVVVHPELAHIRRKPIESLGAYDTLLLFYDYVAKMSPAAHARVLHAIVPALQADPDAATLQAIRAFLYLHMYRFGFNVQGSRNEALQEALHFAREAVQTDPFNPRAHHVLSLAQFSTGDLRGFRETAKRALELNPNDADMLANFGLYLILSEETSLGRVLLKMALTLNPEPPEWYWLAFFWQHFTSGEFEEALDMVLRFQNDDFYWAHCMQAAAYSKLGMQETARTAVQRLLAIYPGFPLQARHELALWLNPSRTAEILALLDEVGLKVE